MKKANKAIGIILTLAISLMALLTLVACEKHEHNFGEWQCVSPEGTPCEQREYEQKCDCGEKKTRNGSQDDHDFEVETVEPSCTQGYDLSTCTICGKTEKANYTPAEHELNNEYLFDSQAHWQVCKNCDYTSDPENHDLYETGICKVCEQQINSTQGIIYELSDNGEYYIVTGYNGTEQDVVIASTYNNKPVKAIGDNAFKNNTTLSSIELNSVTSIGSAAFYNCSALRNIEMNSVTRIENEAFHNCYSLTGVELNSVERIGSYAFSVCLALTKVVIGSIDDWGDFAFSNCLALTSVVIGEVKNGYNYLFSDCSSLTRLEIGSIDYVSPYLILYDQSLEHLVLGTVGSIGEYAFEIYENLETVEIDHVDNIEFGAFIGCTNLTNLVLGTVGSIQSYAFCDCPNLTSIFLKGTLDDIGPFDIEGNDALLDLDYYVYSETEPTAEGNYWHYNEIGKVVVWGKEDEQPPVETTIYIDDSDMPAHTTFLQGQELDLWGGYLTVIAGGEKTKIHLTSPDITISGYDKNQTGKQTLTISYAGKTTTLEVTVFRRLEFSVENPDELKFFQGTEFVVPNGEVILTYDSGSQVSVSLSSSTVAISVPESFSETVGKKTVSVSVLGYTGEFEIEVLEVADISFNAPIKRYYQSHETQIDLTDGYILYRDAKAVNGQADGLEKYFELTQDMIVEGTFNPAAATYEDNYKGIDGNADLSQGVRFVFNGREYRLDIVIEFSDVSLIKHYINVLGDVNWSDGGFDCTDEQINMAVEAAKLYFGFSNEEKAMFVADSLKPIMTLAAYSTYNTWLEGIENYNDVIIITHDRNTGTVEVSCEIGTYAETKANVIRLKESAFAELTETNALLSDILSNKTFAAFEYEQGLTVADYCDSAVSQADIDHAVGGLELAVNIYDALEGITIDDVADFSTVTESVKQKINSCKDLIVKSELLGERSFFATVESWRPGTFEIFYQYFYDVAIDYLKVDSSATNCDTNDGLNVIYHLGRAYLPGLLEDFYENALKMYEVSIVDEYSGGVADASDFFYYYGLMRESADSINNSKELYKNLFSVMQFASPKYGDFNYNISYVPAFAEQILLDAEVIGLRIYKKVGYDLAEYEALIAKYLPLVKMYLSGDYLELNSELAEPEYVMTEQFRTAVPKFFRSYLDCTSGVQTWFLKNLSSEEGIFDMSEQKTVLSNVMGLYYSQTLDEDTYEAFGDLLVAFEVFLRRNASSSYPLRDFIRSYENAVKTYNGLSTDQQAQISFFYDYMVELAGLVHKDTYEFEKITISDASWNTKFDNMAALMGDYYFAYMYAVNYGAYATYLEISQKVDSAYAEFVAEINAVDNEELRVLLLNALQFKTYNIKYTYNSSIQDCYLDLRSVSMNILGSAQLFDDVSLLTYWTDEMKQKLVSTSDISFTMFLIVMGHSPMSELIGRTDFDGVFKSFLSFNGEWTLEQKIVFTLLHNASEKYLVNLFDYAFWTYYTAKTGIEQSTEGDDAINLFINLVKCYNSYAYNLTDSKAAQNYQTVLTQFNSAYGKLTAAQKTAFDAEFGEFIAAYKTAPQA